MTDQLPRVEAAKLLLDEWKFRQAHIWVIFYRSSFAIITLAIVPYAARDILQELPVWISCFLPGLGAVLSVAAGLLFLKEYQRLAKVRDTYNDTLGNFVPRAVGGIRIGTMMCLWFLLLGAFSVFTIYLDAVILSNGGK